MVATTIPFHKMVVASREETMTQPTKPSAGASPGALRAWDAAIMHYHAGGTRASCGLVIDRETGMGELSELLEAAKGAVVYLQRINLSLGIPVKETLQQAIAKCEGKGSE